MIDVTFDFETCSLSPTAAVMSIGAVAWKRYGKESPFFDEGDGVLRNSTFSAKVDLRSMFINGFAFDKSTAEWWSKQSNEAKAALLDSDSDEAPCQPIDVVVNDFFGWIDYIKKKLGDDDICLWAQGTDFDPAILRYICWKLGIKLEIKHTQLRDHRTFYLEMARILWDAAGVKEEPFTLDRAYALTTDYKDIADEGAAHDPIFDCKRSIYSTWQMMKKIREGYAKTV
ncbi:3'-5' exonuclease [Prevotella sp.]|uniref:3'-5' exonuclease n=1 Tax=Prevotella sp. TaxID=59823 RepID=UPI003AF597A6